MFGMSEREFFQLAAVVIFAAAASFKACRVYKGELFFPPLKGIIGLRAYVEEGEAIDPAMKKAKEIIDKANWRRECGYRVVVVVGVCLALASEAGWIRLK